MGRTSRQASPPHPRSPQTRFRPPASSALWPQCPPDTCERRKRCPRQSRHLLDCRPIDNLQTVDKRRSPTEEHLPHMRSASTLTSRERESKKRKHTSRLSTSASVDERTSSQEQSMGSL
eukprot:762691-Hanusia_phi.AAC.2